MPVPVAAARPDRLVGHVFRGSQVVETGWLTPSQLRSPVWRRLRRDVYADAELPPTHRLHTRGVRQVMPRAAAFGGLTAALLWGAAHLVEAADPVEVILPPGVRWDPGPGVRVRHAQLTGEVVHDGTFRWTDRSRTALDLIRRGPGDDAVVLLDRLVQADVVELRDVRKATAELSQGRGSRQARKVAALADGLAQSPPETRVRLLLGRSGLPMPTAQYAVRHLGRFVAAVDFAWPEHRLALEYDGLWHAEPGQFSRDRARLNRLLAAGWRVLFVTAGDLYHPAELVDRIAAALCS